MGRCLLKATTEGPALHSLLLAAELQDATFPAAALLTRLRKSAKEVCIGGWFGQFFQMWRLVVKMSFKIRLLVCIYVVG